MLHAFYSDPHFGHYNIIDYAFRPFKSADEMNEALIERYNEVIGPGDCCVWLGDCFLMPFDQAEVIMRRLNGGKILVMGNHDRSESAMARLGFDLVLREASLVIGGRRCRLNHWPYAPANEPRYSVRRDPDSPGRDKYAVRRQGEVLIHGHTHSDRQVKDNQIHVGVDAWAYRPVLFGEVEALVHQHFPV